MIINIGSSLIIISWLTTREIEASSVVVISHTNAKIGELDILNDISEHVILFQLMDNSGNANQTIRITACWIYD